jgi:hypothetical protein
MISWTAMAKVIDPKGSLGDLSYPFGFGIANCISVIHRSKPFVVLNGMVAFRSVVPLVEAGRAAVIFGQSSGSKS